MLISGSIDRNRLLVPTFVSSIDTPADLHEVVALIDTGATRTLVTSRVRWRASLPSLGTIDVRGVNSAAHLPASALHLGFKPDGRATPFMLDMPVRVAVNTPPSDPNAADSYDVLIGMDVLSRGVLTVDGPAGSFSLDIA